MAIYDEGQDIFERNLKKVEEAKGVKDLGYVFMMTERLKKSGGAAFDGVAVCEVNRVVTNLMDSMVDLHGLQESLEQIKLEEAQEAAADAAATLIGELIRTWEGNCSCEKKS